VGTVIDIRTYFLRLLRDPRYMDDFINGLLDLMIISKINSTADTWKTLVKPIANANHLKLITVDIPCTPELGQWSLLSSIILICA